MVRNCLVFDAVSLGNFVKLLGQVEDVGVWNWVLVCFTAKDCSKHLGKPAETKIHVYGGKNKSVCLCSQEDRKRSENPAFLFGQARNLWERADIRAPKKLGFTARSG